MKRLIAFGECMVEMAPDGEGRHRMGFAGDTFNTAWYARRLLGADWDVGYATVVGHDAVSGDMVTFMADAGIATDRVRRHPDRSVGLYLISLKDGERSFAYWRDRSAARTLADDPAALEADMRGADAIYFSGITLAILPPEGRAAFCAAAAARRDAGALVAFDTNLRPALWEDARTMRDGLTAGARAASIVLPGFDDDGTLFADDGPEDTIARYRDAGADCVCVKNGAAPVTLWHRDTGLERIETVAADRVVDSTAAGDSFAAAFIAAILSGKDAAAAAKAGATLAARVVTERGALVEI